MRFLKEVKEETSNRSKLRNLLVLLMRALAISMLVLAFAQPFIPLTDDVKSGKKAVGIYVDNSFSMSALSRDLALIEQGKRRGLDIVNAYNEDDRFQVLTNDFLGKNQRLLDKEEARAAIEEIDISARTRLMSSVLQRFDQSASGSDIDHRFAYLISDFQRYSYDLESNLDTTVEVALVPLQSVREKNISIDSAWFEAPVQMLNQANPLLVKLKNHGDETIENVRLSLEYNGELKPVGQLNIPALSSVIDTIHISVQNTGWQSAVLQITDYPVQFDDTYHMSFYVDEAVNVLIVNDKDKSKYLKAAFQGISYFHVSESNIGSLDYSSFGNYDLVVCNQWNRFTTGASSELESYIRKGGNVLVFPGPSIDIGSYNNFLEKTLKIKVDSFSKKSRAVNLINTDEFVFQNVYENNRSNLKLPAVSGSFITRRSASASYELLMRFRDGLPYLMKKSLEKGNVYFCASPLDSKWNSLSQSAEIFVPMLFRMAMSSGTNQPVAYTIGEEEIVEVENEKTGQEMVYKVRGNKHEFIPQQKSLGPSVALNMAGQIQESGIYEVYLNSENVQNQMAFNYDRLESELDFVGLDELKKNQSMTVIDQTAEANLSQYIKDKSQGRILWRLFLILALVFLGIEILLLRLWKI